MILLYVAEILTKVHETNWDRFGDFKYIAVR